MLCMRRVPFLEIRLAEFKYLDMDKVIENAQKAVKLEFND